MRRIIYIIALVISFPLLWSACEDDKFENSIYDDFVDRKPDYVGEWIEKNYVDPHNIEVLYRWEDMETDLSVNLVPPTLDTIIPFLKMVKHSWINTYLDLCGKDIMNPIFPKQILLLGTGGYNEDGTKTLGTAEGGKKMILYGVDEFNPRNRENVTEYVRIMHHEFGHILNQKKSYPLGFKKITPDTYTITWFNVSNSNALNAGFVSPYAMSEPSEDFVEVIAIYIVNTPESWDALIAEASASGKEKIAKKLEMVRTYLEESWKIDLDVLRQYVNQAIDDVLTGNY